MLEGLINTLHFNINYILNFNSRKHKNELLKLIREKKINFDCKICGYFALDNNDWEVHVTSEGHVNSAKLFKKPNNAAIPPPIVLPSQTFTPIQQVTQAIIPPLMPPTEPPTLDEKKVNEELEKKLNEKALRQILSRNNKEWKCANCNVICQSSCSYNAHMASKKHKKNAHKFRTYPGITKEVVQKKYMKSFVRANESIGNEFIEDGVIFFCKRCNVRMQTKAQLEIHMDSNMHKMNFPIQPPISSQHHDAATNSRFESSAYGYAGRNWVYEQQFLMQSQAEKQQQMEQEYERQLIEKAKNDLLARFPYYAMNSQQQPPQDEFDPQNIPMPVESPSDTNFRLYDSNNV